MSTPFSKRTVSINSESVKRNWILIDAADKILGRLATETAKRLRGKHKPEYTPHADTGDYVVVINAEKIKVTGDKANQKEYIRHSGYPGGIKSTRYKDLQKAHPERIIEIAVKGMLPRTPLGRAMLSKLKVYVGNEHPHTAQQPIVLELNHLNSEG